MTPSPKPASIASAAVQSVVVTYVPIASPNVGKQYRMFTAMQARSRCPRISIVAGVRPSGKPTSPTFAAPDR